MRENIVIPRAYLLFGLPHNRPEGREWQAKSGLCLRGSAEHGAPFHRARAILIYLATRSIDEGQMLVGRLHDIRQMFGVSWSLRNIEEHFLRLVHSTYRCTEHGCICGPAPCRHQQPVADYVSYCRTTHKFRVQISFDFYRLYRLGFWCPLAPVATLLQKKQMVALDILVWYRLRQYREQFAPVNPFGPEGPFALAKCTKACFRQRQVLPELDRQIAEAWPAAPFHYDAGRKRFVRGCRANLQATRLPRAPTITAQPQEPTTGVTGPEASALVATAAAPRPARGRVVMRTKTGQRKRKPRPLRQRPRARVPKPPKAQPSQQVAGKAKQTTSSQERLQAQLERLQADERRIREHVRQLGDRLRGNNTS